MSRPGLALRRAFVAAGFGIATLLNSASFVDAQDSGAPLPFAAAPEAYPLGNDFAPYNVAPVGYHSHREHAVATEMPYGSCGCENLGACDACAPTHVCDSCNPCNECSDCVACQPCCPPAFGPWYVGLSGGWAHRERVHEVNDPLVFIDFSDGFAANAVLGYEFAMFRVEAEYSFMNTECEFAGGGAAAAAAGIAPSAATGNVNLRALMFNIYHDIELPNLLWKPYLGAGIGLYQSEINSLYPAFFADPALAPFGFNTNPVNTTSDIPFAYQFRAGVSRPLSERTEFYSGYRYFRGEDLTFASAPFANPAAPTFEPNGAKVHSVEFGLRVRF